ncbi:WD40/YVTN/BNR-like repeat-containing protein [Paenibacillus koleovorans]|uniref:WD40/YVTN/BNR-like repeat-containing protein n=1 Tax=Paenibacillus koleovorans TaxID=121608 RepID=UPI001FE9EC6E|nr:hypothetical protein [Paenibacillus koleovorans]
MDRIHQKKPLHQPLFASMRWLTLALLIVVTILSGCKSSTPESSDATVTPTMSGSPSSSATPAGSATPGSGGTASPSPGSGGSVPGGSSPLDNTTGRVTAVRLIDPQAGWTGGDGWISRTEDGGKSWTKQYQGKGIVQQIFALNGKSAWAVISPDAAKPDQRQLLHTADGGKVWSAVGPMPNAAFLHFVSESEAFSGNAHSTDGGKTWTTLKVPGGIAGDANFHDKANGWAAVNGANTIEVHRTVDGGATWEKVLSRATSVPLTGAVIRSAGKGDAWVEAVGESGMSQTSYSLFHTTDGGKSWQPVLANSTAGGGPAPGFPMDYYGGPQNNGAKPGPLYVVDPQTAFLAGYCPACDKPNSIGWTKDAGKTWVNGKTEIGGFVGSLLAMADANKGWWIGTDLTEPSVMYTTADGGASWTKVFTFDKPKQ